MTEKKNPLEDLLLHVKNRPKYPHHGSTRNDYIRACIKYDDWIDELVGKTQELALSLAKEPALRNLIQAILEDLEKKAKTQSTLTFERAKVWNKGDYKEDKRLGQLLYVSIIDVLDTFSELRKAVFGKEGSGE